MMDGIKKEENQGICSELTGNQLHSLEKGTTETVCSSGSTENQLICDLNQTVIKDHVNKEQPRQLEAQDSTNLRPTSSLCEKSEEIGLVSPSMQRNLQGHDAVQCSEMQNPVFQESLEKGIRDNSIQSQRENHDEILKETNMQRMTQIDQENSKKVIQKCNLDQQEVIQIEKVSNEEVMKMGIERQEEEMHMEQENCDAMQLEKANYEEEKQKEQKNNEEVMQTGKENDEVMQISQESLKEVIQLEQENQRPLQVKSMEVSLSESHIISEESAGTVHHASKIIQLEKTSVIQKKDELLNEVTEINVNDEKSGGKVISKNEGDTFDTKEQMCHAINQKTEKEQQLDDKSLQNGSSECATSIDQGKVNNKNDKPHESDKQKQQNKTKQQQPQQQQSKKQKATAVSENHERINYLAQASQALVKLGKKDNDTQESLEFDRPLASQTGSLASAIGRRCLIRLSPSLKRTLCKGCGTVLIYGVNARVRHRSNRQKHLVITCLTCKTIKRFVNDPKHKLWCEQEEALA